MLKTYAFTLAAGAAVIVAVCAGPIWASTIENPYRPGILGEDSRILGARESVTLTRWRDRPGPEMALTSFQAALPRTPAAINSRALASRASVITRGLFDLRDQIRTEP